jgi:Zn-dependent oligopeptidase
MASSPSPSPTRSHAQEAVLEPYLEDVRPAFEAELAGTETYLAAVQKVVGSGSTDLDWMLGQLRDGSATLSTQLAAAHDVVDAVTPPEDLEKANQSLAKCFSAMAGSLGEMAEIYDQMAAVSPGTDRYEELGEKLRQIGSAERNQRIETLMNDWDSAVDKAAKSEGAELPDWLKERRRRLAQPWWQGSSSSPL